MVWHHHLLICYGCCIEAVTVAHIHLAFAQVAELGVRTASRVILLRSLDSSMLLNCADALVLLCVGRFLLFELRVWWMQLSRHRWWYLIINRSEARLWVSCPVRWSNSVSSRHGNLSRLIISSRYIIAIIFIISSRRYRCHVHRLCPLWFLQTIGLILISVSVFGSFGAWGLSIAKRLHLPGWVDELRR